MSNGEFHSGNLSGQDSIEVYIAEYPNQEQVKMMSSWLENNEAGTFTFTGLVDPSDDTVVTPQATVDYGYCWFSLSNGPAILRTPHYNKFVSVSVFDMKHNVPAVIVQPELPMLLIRPGQPVPEGQFHVVELETDQGLVFTRMIVLDNMDEVRELSRSFLMEGGRGSMIRPVQRFSPGTKEAGMAVIDAFVPYLNPDDAFGKRSGDVGIITAAAGVKLGQLGTPPDTVRYGTFFTNESGEPLNGEDTYVLTVAAGIVEDNGYFSVTIYGSDNQLLIPNDQQVYDRTTYSSEQNSDGTYTITLSPNGEGKNGIPTGKPFYGILRGYVPTQDADMTVTIETK